MTPWRQKTLNSSFNLCYERDTFIMSIVGNKRDGYLCVCVYVSERVYVCVCVCMRVCMYAAHFVAALVAKLGKSTNLMVPVHIQMQRVLCSTAKVRINSTRAM